MCKNCGTLGANIQVLIHAQRMREKVGCVRILIHVSIVLSSLNLLNIACMTS